MDSNAVNKEDGWGGAIRQEADQLDRNSDRVHFVSNLIKFRRIYLPLHRLSMVLVFQSTQLNLDQ
jgi:hypothetical protein